jgi:hypothetical protein
MANAPRASPVWQALIEGAATRVEVWVHPKGWQCRVFSHGQLLRISLFADFQYAHHEAARWFALLTSATPGGAAGRLQ